MPRLNKQLRKIVMSLFVAILLLYPLIVYFGLSYLNIRVLAAILLVVFIGRIAVSGKTNTMIPAAYMMVLALAGITICLISFLSNNSGLFKLYPLIVNLAFAAVFMMSILNPPTVIERMARLENPNLSATGLRYTGDVTKVWLIFFITNALVSAYTIFFASTKIWTLYNGLISYLLMACLFLGEYMFRIRVKKREKAGLG